jgi:multicomponent Na+:H+ antiporter subunit C
MIGFYAMMAKTNLVKKLIGMNIFQVANILYFMSIAAKKGGTIPILIGGHHAIHHEINPLNYINPLPQVLMLTAIVVSIATTGVALAILIMIYRKHGTLEEDEILGENG